MSAGYSTNLFLVNALVPVLVIAAHIALLIFYALLTQSTKICKCSCLVRVKDKLGDYLFWNGFLRLFTEAYCQLVLFSLLNLRGVEWQKGIPLVESSDVSAVVAIILCTALPLLFCIILWCNKDNWKNEGFVKKFDCFISELKHDE